METKYKYGQTFDMEVGQSKDNFTLLRPYKSDVLGEVKWNMLNKNECGMVGAKENAEEIARRFNAHDELVKALESAKNIIDFAINNTKISSDKYLKEFINEVLIPTLNKVTNEK